MLDTLETRFNIKMPSSEAQQVAITSILGPGFNLAETLAQVDQLVSFETKVQFVTEFFDEKHVEIQRTKIIEQHAAN